MSKNNFSFSSETEQEIFSYFLQEHNVTLLQSDFWELENIINKNISVIPECLNRESIKKENFTKDEIDDLQQGGIH